MLNPQAMPFTPNQLPTVSYQGIGQPTSAHDFGLKFHKHSPNFISNLDKCGAVSDDTSFEVSNLDLDLDIHPILQKDNWHPNQTDQYWDDIRPALQLASYFLTEQKSLEFWAKLIHEDLHLESDKVFITTPEFTDKLLEETKTILENLAKHVLYYPHGSISYDQCTHASTITVSPKSFNHRPGVIDTFPDFKSNAYSHSGPNFTTNVRQCELTWASPIIAIDFHPKIWDGYKNLEHPDFMTKDGKECQRMRLNFGLAIDIVHELSHAVWIYTRLGGDRSGYPSIHFDFETDSDEKGYAWETHTFSAILCMMAKIPVMLQCFKRPVSKFSDTSGSDIVEQAEEEGPSEAIGEDAAKTKEDNAFKQAEKVSIKDGHQEGHSEDGGTEETESHELTGQNHGDQNFYAQHGNLAMFNPLRNDLWVMGYLPGCPLFYDSIYRHHKEQRTATREKVWHLVPMSYVNKWFLKTTWEKIRTDAAMPKLECCGVIVEEHKNPVSLEGFHGEYVVYRRL